MAVDGDPDTAWVVGDGASPVGQSITIEGWGEDTFTLLQSQDPVAVRLISEVRLEGDLGERTLPLDERSWTAPGQPVRVDDLATAGARCGS